jgi:beta-galactosidase
MYPDEKLFGKLCNQEPTTFGANVGLPSKKYFHIKKEHYETMPVVLCEYAHCMENSLGNFREYIVAFERYDHLCGGFIWDFVDQAIRIKDASGERWLYGTDFSEEYDRKNGYKSRIATGSSRYFCANGIVAADRAPHPATVEVKKCYQTLRVTESDAKSGEFVIRNMQMFSDFSAYRLAWTLEADGEKIAGDDVPAEEYEDTPPGETARLRLALPELPEGLVTLTFRWTLRGQMSWAEAGYEQAFDQFVLQSAENEVPQMQDEKNISFQQHDGEVIVSGDGFVLRFMNGALASFRSGDVEYLAEPLVPNFYRALTDNDRAAANFVPFVLRFMNVDAWRRAAKKQRAKMRAEVTAGGVVIEASWKHPFLKQAGVRYTVRADGSVEIEQRTVSRRRTMLRAGLQCTLCAGFDTAHWLGRGPEENYPDRKTGSAIGLYRQTIEALEHPYMRPQENGARCDVETLILEGENKKLAVKNLGESLIFSVWRYTQKELDEAEHQHELTRHDETTLSLDGAMCGVGGDLPGMAMLHDAYKMKPGVEYRTHVLLTIEK